MTDWSLITGIIPPLTTSDWIETFDKYKLSPEFTFKNYDMTIEEFKKIFFGNTFIESGEVNWINIYLATYLFLAN